MERGRIDSVSLAGIAVFGALAILLSAASQSLGLNFPVIPYLQFDLGEVAVVMALYIFGPIPAAAASFVEFVGLEAYGLNRPFGPAIKLGALLSSVAGLWLGTRLVSGLARVSVRNVVISSASVGIVARVAAMTLANYYLVVFIYGLGSTVSFYNLPQTFSAIGIGWTSVNALLLILVFTGIFNALQLAFVIALSYTVLRFPPVTNLRVGGRAPWFIAVTAPRTSHEGALH